jgi:predicted metal-dependent phosphoesterase TrpH
MRCDLHVHSRFSGRCTVPVLRRFVDECYAEPEQVFATARRRGMDLVTLTDHDTITGVLALAGRPETFVSEEVTCELGGGRSLHLGVYDLSEGQHEAIARRRTDAESLFAYLAEQRLPVALNHPFSALTGPRETADLERAFRAATLVESRNGMLPPSTNGFAQSAAERAGLPTVGGSDSHTLRGVARAYTVVPGARTRDEFVAGLRQGLTLPAGRSGTYAGLALDLLRLAGLAYASAAREVVSGGRALAGTFRLLAAAPIVPLLPLVAAFVHHRELWFAAHHFRAYAGRVAHHTQAPLFVRRASAA